MSGAPTAGRRVWRFLAHGLDRRENARCPRCGSPDDAAAMREIQRVLKPGSWSVLMVPFERSRAETFEDPSVTDASERLRRFGQHDHVRVYGRDYTERLRRPGLDVLEDELVRELEGREYGPLDEPVHVGVKPAAAATAEPYEPLDALA